MLKFIFLGANGSIQERDSGNTSLLFSDGMSTILVDASVNLYVAVEAQIDAVVLTHEHIDHMYALPSLLHQLWLEKRTKPLKIICPDGIRPMVEGLIDNFSIRSKKGIFDIVFEPATENCVGDIKLSFFKTVHTPNSVGMIVQSGTNKIVYTCDTAPISKAHESLPSCAFNPDILIHESNSLSDVRKPDHSGGLEAAKLAQELGAKRLILCHLPKGEIAKQAILKEAKTIYSKTQLPNILKEEILY